ncbi:MAG: hypothetical protein LBD72_02080 [Puniceicoccales bacterium]|jgi:hypothetical protein|nr:hypothetical protein [Puniceicoccales bacterium]
MDCQLADPMPPASMDNQFRDATAMLFSTYADGERIFSDEEGAAKMGQWNERVRQQNMVRSIDPYSTVADLVQILESANHHRGQ